MFYFSFEHVFVGEISGSSVSGFHNWIQIYQQELAGNLDYFGYTDISEVCLFVLFVASLLTCKD